jgi:hypothetical protein
MPITSLLFTAPDILVAAMLVIGTGEPKKIINT